MLSDYRVDERDTGNGNERGRYSFVLYKWITVNGLSVKQFRRVLAVKLSVDAVTHRCQLGTAFRAGYAAAQSDVRESMGLKPDNAALDPQVTGLKGQVDD